jgi:hypothetical protein
VVWRASVSDHYFFGRVNLGRYEAIIASILNGGSADSYAIPTILGEFDSDDVPILDPYFTRIGGVRFWVIYANRFVFYIQADRQRTPSEFTSFCLKAGQPLISLVRSWENSKELPALRTVAQANPNAFRQARA